MANTWQGAVVTSLPSKFEASMVQSSDPPTTYTVRQLSRGLSYSVEIPGRPQVILPVEVVMGGARHGLGFLVRVKEVQGLELARPALVQSRYFWSFTKHGLVIAPGLSTESAPSLEAALGLTLTPTFETKCLTCHGQPNSLGAGSQGGVRCEGCHGPGWQHLRALGAHDSSLGIVNPANLSAELGMAICVQCHAGFGPRSDPSPEDLLIANQATALTRSECFIQSGKRFGCISCHNPHRDSGNDLLSAVKTCIGCHSADAKPHAATCPVNQKADCIRCHMPSVEMGPLHLVDHLIRVHPEQNIKAVPQGESLRSQIPPQRQVLQLIATQTRPQAEEAARRLAQGESFFNVARSLSIDSTAPIGGYLGEKWVLQMEPEFAATAMKLDYGEYSPVVPLGSRWIILRRLPRDFRWQADQLLQAATVEMRRNDFKSSIAKCQQALAIYPFFLRALVFMGVAMRESGRPQEASNIFQVSALLYPCDAATLLQLALTYRSLGDHPTEISAYRKAIKLDPELLSAYVNLGSTLYGTGNTKGAIEVFREGLQVDPLSAELYYDLSFALHRQGDDEGSRRNEAIATALNPGIIPVWSKYSRAPEK